MFNDWNAFDPKSETERFFCVRCSGPQEKFLKLLVCECGVTTCL